MNYLTLEIPKTNINGKGPAVYSLNVILSLALAVAMNSLVAQAADENVNACAEQMMKKFGEKGWVGITPEYGDDRAIIVVHVFANSPAEKAGILKGDLVRGINGQDRETAPGKFLEEYDALRPNQATDFDLERDGRRLTVSVMVEPIPQAVLERWIQEECDRLASPQVSQNR